MPVLPKEGVFVKIKYTKVNYDYYDELYSSKYVDNIDPFFKRNYF